MFSMFSISMDIDHTQQPQQPENAPKSKKTCRYPFIQLCGNRSLKTLISNVNYPVLTIIVTTLSSTTSAASGRGFFSNGSSFETSQPSINT